MNIDKRDFMASQAMYSVMLTFPAKKLYDDDDTIPIEVKEKIAEQAYQMADLMFKQSKKLKR